MEIQSSPAEELPALYRRILDGVAQLEGLGYRPEAAIVRAEATKAYSASWNDDCRRRLTHLIRRVDRIVSGDERPRAGGRRARSTTGGSLLVR